VTSSPNAGQRLKAANAAFPKLFSAAASAPVTVSTATATDISDASITITTANAGAQVLVIGVFDIQVVTTSGVAVALGSCAVNGSAQLGNATHDLTTVGNRGTVTQAWVITSGAAGSYTIKLQAQLSGASGSATFNGTHTTITATVYDW